jgi:diguanylate cyclase (GGDEF)-like protein/PAS domain S-box-containing protein
MRDEDKKKEQLLKELADMRQRIAELETWEVARRRAEETLREQSLQLRERVKELNCLYGISRLAEKQGTSTEEILRGIIDLIPPSWQYPEIACARVILEGKELTTGNFRETIWEQSRDIIVHGRRAGVVEVFYLEERPEQDEGPFLAGERELINAIAERLGRMIERIQAEEALRESEKRYKALFEGAVEGILVADIETRRFVYANPALCKMLGYSAGELKQMGVQDIHPKEALPHVISEFEAQARGEKMLAPSIPCLRKDGTTIYADINTAQMTIDGRGCNVGFFTDITERRRMEEALRESEEKLRVITGSALDAIVMMDDKGKVAFWNPAAEKLFGYSRDEITGKDVHETLAPPQYHEAFKKGLEVFRRTGQGAAVGKVLELTALRKDGTEFPIGIAVSSINIKGIWWAVATIRDITERKRMEDELRALSMKDELTGLHNRRGFLALAEQQVKRANRTKKEMLLLFVDLDRMKWINDTLGHHEGDRALVQIADILKQTFRASDIVARVGGDEFVVLAIEAYAANTEFLISRLQDKLSAYNASTAQPYDLSVSIGFARYDPQNPSSVETMLAEADSLMYDHKRSKQKS